MVPNSLNNDFQPGGWLVVLRIYVASGVLQPYRDLEARNNQSLKIQVARPGIEIRSSCSASQPLGSLCSQPGGGGVSGQKCRSVYDMKMNCSNSTKVLTFLTASQLRTRGMLPFK